MLCEPLPCWPQLSPVTFDSRAGITRAPAVFPSQCQLWNCCACAAQPLTEAQHSWSRAPAHQHKDWAPCADRGSPNSFPLLARSFWVTGSEFEVQRDIWALVSPAPLLKAGSARAGCSGTSPDDFWMSPRMGTPPPTWAACAHAQPPSHQSFLISGESSQISPRGHCSCSSHWAPLTKTWLLSSCPSGILYIEGISPNLLFSRPGSPSPAPRAVPTSTLLFSMFSLEWGSLLATPQPRATFPSGGLYHTEHGTWMLSTWGSSVLHYQEDQLSMAPGSNFSTAVGKKPGEGSDHYL